MNKVSKTIASLLMLQGQRASRQENINITRPKRSERLSVHVAGHGSVLSQDSCTTHYKVGNPDELSVQAGGRT